jgi:hypothetical protein
MLTTGRRYPDGRQRAIVRVINSMTIREIIGAGRAERDDYGSTTSRSSTTGARRVIADPEFDGSPASH